MKKIITLIAFLALGVRGRKKESQTMKKLCILFCFLLTGNYIFAQQKVYYVGHSLVNLDIPYMVQQIVTNAGVNGDYRHHINIGTGLKVNWIDTAYNGNEIWNPDLMMNIEYGSNHLTELLHPFQHIVITESVPLVVSNKDTSIKYGANFYNLARTYSPTCRKYLYATWEGDAHNISTWKPLIQSLKAEWEAIADGLAAASGGDPVDIVPGNIALLSLADSIAGGGLGSISSISGFFNPDGLHLNADGNYFIACLMAAVVYHVNPVGQPAVHAGPYKPLADSTISDDINRLKIQQLSVAVACSYARTGAQSLCGPLGIVDNTAKDSRLRIFPNPVKSDQDLLVESKAAQAFVVLNRNGQVCAKGRFKKGKNTLHLSMLGTGMYFIKSENEIQKVIIH